MNLKKRCSTLLVCAVTLASLAIANLPSLTVSAQEPTEIVSKRTAYEKHYDNHDGTTTALIHSTPLHYLDDGEWRDMKKRFLLFRLPTCLILLRQRRFALILTPK